jgi:hypothetical protein
MPTYHGTEAVIRFSPAEAEGRLNNRQRGDYFPAKISQNPQALRGFCYYRRNILLGIDWLVMDLLGIWGVTQAAGALVFPIMQELAKDSAKDYVKGFFKTSLINVLKLPTEDEQTKAYGKAMKAFLELFYQQLVMAGLPDDRIISFEQPLKVFIQEETVAAKLGDAFKSDCQILDTSYMAQAWQSLRLPSLPQNFNWEVLGRFYLQKVKEIITSSDKLKAIFQEERSIRDSDNK